MNASGYVIIEGNIGVGKSTFSAILAEEFKRAGLRAEYLPEPDETTNPFLEAYYKDPAAHAYEMQCHLLHKRFEATQYAVAGARADGADMDALGVEQWELDRLTQGVEEIGDNGELPTIID